MSSYVFNHIKDKVAEGTINFKTKNYKLMLVTDSIFADPIIQDNTTWAQISAYDIRESTYNTSGYNGPVDIINVSDTTSNGEITLSGSDITYNVSTIDSDGVVIYDDGNHLVCAIDFGGKVSSNNGVFNINLSEGFLKIK